MANNYFHLIISVVGIVAGCIAFFVFKYQFNNETDANWSLATFCVSGLMLFLRIHLMGLNLEENPPNADKNFLPLLCMCGLLSASSGMYFGLKSSVTYFQTNQYTTSVLCLLLVLWSLLLFWTALNYRDRRVIIERIIDDQYDIESQQEDKRKPE